LHPRLLQREQLQIKLRYAILGLKVLLWATLRSFSFCTPPGLPRLPASAPPARPGSHGSYLRNLPVAAYAVFTSFWMLASSCSRSQRSKVACRKSILGLFELEPPAWMCGRTFSAQSWYINFGLTPKYSAVSFTSNGLVFSNVIQSLLHYKLHYCSNPQWPIGRYFFALHCQISWHN